MKLTRRSFVASTGTKTLIITHFTGETLYSLVTKLMTDVSVCVCGLLPTSTSTKPLLVGTM